MKHSNLSYKVLKLLYNKIMTSCYYIMRFFKVKDNKIVISSYFGRGYGGNSKYIVSSLFQQNVNYDIVWLVQDTKEEMPIGIRTVKYNSIKAIYELVTARLWIDNARKAEYVRKRKKQFYIQTWHGCLALKKIEKDAEKALPKYYIKSAIQDSKMANLMVSNSKFCTNLYKNSFWYNGKIIECGSPRNDIIVNYDEKSKKVIKGKFNIDNNIKVVLYAPTFRKNKNLDIYDVNYKKLTEVLNKKFGGGWCVMVRLHPGIAEKSNFINYNDYVLNASNYSDMQELLTISDILITDYSSSMFDFMLTKKPIFLYSSDMDDYIKDRDFYFDYYNLPFSIATNNVELGNNILSYNEKDYIGKVKSFIKENEIKENGNASVIIADIIKRVIIERNGELK